MSCFEAKVGSTSVSSGALFHTYLGELRALTGYLAGFKRLYLYFYRKGGKGKLRGSMEKRM